MKTSHTKPLPIPCATWAKQLAALHPDDLTADERAALQKHLADCADCAAVYVAYQAIDTHILSLPPVQLSAQQMVQLEASIDDQTHNNPRWQPAASNQKQPVLPERRPTRLAGLQQRVSLLAAVLLVMVLAGSAFALFSARHPSASGSGGTPGTLYAVSSAGTAYAVNASDGKILWSTPLHMRPSEQFVVAGGKLFVGSNDYNLYGLQTSDGHVLWERSYKALTTVGMGNQTVQIAPYPASDGNAIYFAAPKGIYAWRASDGAQLWSYPGSPSPYDNMQSVTIAPEVETVNNGVVYAYLDGLYALNAADGSVRWHDTRVPNDTKLVVAQGHVYVASYGGGDMRVLQADNGQLLNIPALPRVKPYDMITDGTTVYLRGPSGRTSEDVYALRSGDDTLLWHKQYPNSGFGLFLSGVGNHSLYLSSLTTTPKTFEPGNLKPSQLTPVTRTPTQLTPVTRTPIVIQQLSGIHVCTVSATDGSLQRCLDYHGGMLSVIANQQTIYAAPSALAASPQGIVAIRFSDNKVLWTALNNVSLVRTILG